MTNMSSISVLSLLLLLLLALSSSTTGNDAEEEEQLVSVLEVQFYPEREEPRYIPATIEANHGQGITGKIQLSSSGPILQLCRDQPGQTTASNGTIQSLFLSGQTVEQRCRVTIIAPLDYQIQMSCSVLAIVPYSNSYLKFENIIDSGVVTTFPNRVYTSSLNEMAVNTFYRSSDRFECKWTTVPSTPPTTSEFKICRHWQTTAASGTIQPPDRDSGPSRDCSFWLQAPPDHQIQMVCSTVDLIIADSSLKIVSAADIEDAVIPNRIYSSMSNSLTLMSKIGYSDFFRCNWTIVPPTTTTDFKLCRHGETKSPSGTIQPLDYAVRGREWRTCRFSIVAPVGQRILISCSVVNLTYAWSYLSLTLNRSPYVDVNPPLMNKTYTSTSNELTLTSRSVYLDWFVCKWTTTTSPATTTASPTTTTTTAPSTTITTRASTTTTTTAPSTTTTTAFPATTTTAAPIYRVCGDYNSTSATGRIQPLDYLPWQCFFRILAPPDQQVQFTCPVVNLTTSTFQITGAVDVYMDGSSLISAARPVLNRVYTSQRNALLLSYKLVQGDSIDCNWTTIPTLPSATTNIKLCRHWRTTATNGTIQPLALMTAGESRWCRFTIIAPFSDDQRVQMSCSVIRLGSSESTLKLIEGSQQFYNSVIVDSPVPNTVYTSKGSSMGVELKLYNTDWIECNWTTTPTESEITQQQFPIFKLCRDSNATVARGTIQPLFNVSELSYLCSFSIIAPIDQRIQISCSIVKLHDFYSFLQFDTGLMSIFDYEPIVNRLYTSKGNTVKLYHRVVNAEDWFDCKWNFI